VRVSSLHHLRYHCSRFCFSFSKLSLLFRFREMEEAMYMRKKNLSPERFAGRDQGETYVQHIAAAGVRTRLAPYGQRRVAPHQSFAIDAFAG
jgi:hypothetical protein